MNWGEIVQIMNAEFNSPIRQQSMFNRLIRIPIEDLMVDGETEAQALRDTILEIKRLTGMARPQAQYDEHKRLFLENAVSKTLWKINVVSVIGDGLITYRSLSTKFVKAQAKYAIRQNLISGSTSTETYRKSRWDTSEDKKINYGGQSRYGRNPFEVGRNQSISPHRNRVSFPQDRPFIV